MLKLSNEIKMIISDFDGIFTDGGLYVSEDGKTSKKMNFLDIMAVFLLKRNGIRLAVISGENSAALEHLKNRFEVEDVYGAIRDKKPIVLDLMKKYNLSSREVAYIGDDINDIDAMMITENRFTVPNAVRKVKAVPNIQITEASGGSGAFRELADTILDNINVEVKL